MPDSRELEFRILTTAETRGLDDTTRALDDLGRATETTGSDLTDIGRDLDRLADDARSSARTVGTAMDGMADDTKRATDKMDRELKDAGHEGFDTLKDEAGSSGREAAASFTGSFDDITSGIQEVAANALGGFGPLGAAAGLAAAAGIGMITSAISDAKERLKELTDAFTDLKIEGGGMGEAVKIVLDDLRQNGDLVQLSDDAKMLGVDWQTLVRAMAGSKPDLEEVNGRLDDLSTTQAGMRVQGNLANNAFQNLSGSIGRSGEAITDASKEARAYTSAMKGAEAKTSDASGEFVTAKGRANDLRDALANPFVLKVKVDTPSQAQLNAIRRGIVQGIGPVVLDPPRFSSPATLFYNVRPTP